MGIGTADDAAVYKLSDDQALVATVDYITPVVDDPFTWGRIAAANALSDLYAMGAHALFALNVVNWPRETLPLEQLALVLQGGAQTAQEAGIPILGGHTIDDPEPKYGLVALGLVHPDAVLRNVGARPGDALLLTKPLGIGIITTALKRGAATPADADAAVGVMATLNRSAAEALHGRSEVHAVTDVTGFGLLGHLAEMLGGGDDPGGGVGAELSLSSVPVLRAAWELAARGFVPGGSLRNLDAVAERVTWPEGVTEEQKVVLADAQTSGGLLIAVESDAADAVLARIRNGGLGAAARIGVFTRRAGRIDVRP